MASKTLSDLNPGPGESDSESLQSPPDNRTDPTGTPLLNPRILVQSLNEEQFNECPTGLGCDDAQRFYLSCPPRRRLHTGLLEYKRSAMTTGRV